MRLPGIGRSPLVANQVDAEISSDELHVRYLIALGPAVTYIDATNLTAKHRRPFIKIVAHSGCQCEAALFDMPIEERLRRNALRFREVPEEANRAMARRPQPPVEAEGFGHDHYAVVRGCRFVQMDRPQQYWPRENLALLIHLSG